ncbi:zinc-ribbon-domain-containing protein [Powellomyces hirtus]|nr:zinc-ribbon-domain-containing protein [Powellomyces hirtus]
MSSNYTKSLYTNTADPAGSSASNPALLANLQLDPSAEGFGVLRPEDRVKTWHDRDSQILGCKHYQRGAKLQARCCGKWFTCRFCHDEVSDHTLNRQQTTTMLCMHCLHPQPASQHCSACHAQLSTYYCTICKLWDDDRTKHIYHCAACGICRIGRGLGVDYFHCEKCNACMAIGLDGGNHKCIERNLECDCPICGEYMFTSTSTVIFMPCGHCIHYSCHQTYIQTSYQCPTCFKSLSDMTDYFARIDTMLQHHTMPQEYAHMTSKLYCNDCEQRSTAPYHFLYHACGECKGYNTKVLSVEKGGVLVGDGRVAAAESAGAPPGAPASNQAPAPPFLDMERQQNPPPPPPPDEAL